MGKRPDYDLSVLNKVTEERGRIGAGWKNPDGSISIKLNPLTTVVSGPEWVMTLFPAKTTDGSHVGASSPESEDG